MSEQQVEREIAQSVCGQLSLATIIQTDQICRYMEGKYVKGKIAESIVRKTITTIAGTIEIPINKKGDTAPYRLTMAKQRMIIEFVKSNTYIDIDDFDSNGRIINLKNGLYYLDGFLGSAFKPLKEQPEPRKITNKEFEFIQENYDDPEAEVKKRIETHLLGEPVPTIIYFITHEDYIKKYGDPYKSFIQIPVKYDPEAECLEIDQVFTDVYGFKTVPLIYEMTAYLILPTIKYGKAFMLYGPTGTGKTSALNIILKLIGFNNTSGIELQKLEDKFELENTRNKLVNVFDDLSSKPIEFVGNFKKLVTNKYLYGRIKHIQELIRWINRCKGLFACNELPTIKEYVTDAFYIRWVLIPCFNNMKEKGIEDISIRDKIYSESEMSGLFNKCIEAIRRLEKRKNFPEEWQDIDFVKNYWNMDRKPVGKFIEECCILSKTSTVNYEVFIRELNIFRKAHRVKEVGKGTVTKALAKLGITKEDRGSKVDKRNRYYYKGIDFNEKQDGKVVKDTIEDLYDPLEQTLEAAMERTKQEYEENKDNLEEI